jgi:hypothetical protein
MKVVYLITSHGEAPNLVRLCRVILGGSAGAMVVVHHDPRVKSDGLETLRGEARVHVLSDPIEITWGKFSLSEAALIGMRWAIENVGFDWLLWISAQDYPVKPIRAIEAELRDADVDAYLYAFPHDAPDHWAQGEGLNRYFFRYFDLPRFRYWHRVPHAVRRTLGNLRRKLNRVQPAIRLYGGHRNLPAQLGLRAWKTPFSREFPCWGGYNWLNLSRRCVEYVCSFVERQETVVNHYRRTRFPEESLFNSIVMNAEQFRVALSCKRWINWDPQSLHGTSPVPIKADQIHELIRTDAWFARRFDATIDAEALDLVDRYVTAQSR